MEFGEHAVSRIAQAVRVTERQPRTANQQRKYGSPDHRAFPVTNSSGEEIPAYGVARITSVSDDDPTDPGGPRRRAILGKPDEDSIAAAQLVMVPRAIANGDQGYGYSLADGLNWATYSGTAPSAGDDVGTSSGSWALVKDKTGLKANGASGGRALVGPFSPITDGYSLSTVYSDSTNYNAQSSVLFDTSDSSAVLSDSGVLRPLRITLSDESQFTVPYFTNFRWRFGFFYPNQGSYDTFRVVVTANAYKADDGGDGYHSIHTIDQGARIRPFPNSSAVLLTLSQSGTASFIDFEGYWDYAVSTSTKGTILKIRPAIIVRNAEEDVLLHSDYDAYLHKWAWEHEDISPYNIAGGFYAQAYIYSNWSIALPEYLGT